ncbi:MAG: hypothetical protein H0T79_17055, partial [Deltaproteobacteria bacterium]|nr:hypothetical protein [Deltaproteobacteria bacterium]
MRSGLFVIVGLVACARSDGDPPRATSEPATAASVQLPAWFGLPSSPARRIAGQLWDGEVPLAGTVQLRIAAPDATVWTGIDQRTKPDGSFDFGELRAGRYVVLATAPGKTSRLVAIDTLEGAAADVALHGYGCKPMTRAVIAGGRPLQGARVDVGGV